MSYYFIANTKMYLSPEQISDLAQKYNLLAQQYTSFAFCLCPSFETIASAAYIASGGLTIGAQNCSNQVTGAYTGQVSADNLSKLGCRYCIVGHSEARTYLHETNENIAHKVVQLLHVGICPIICVGEEMRMSLLETQNALAQQLDPILLKIRQEALSGQKRPLLIAYEPVWAIGTGQTAPADHVFALFAWIKQYCAPYLKTVHTIYGGALSDQTIGPFVGHTMINGFLVGRAGLDFQTVQKMLQLLT